MVDYAEDFLEQITAVHWRSGVNPTGPAQNKIYVKSANLPGPGAFPAYWVPISAAEYSTLVSSGSPNLGSIFSGVKYSDCISAITYVATFDGGIVLEGYAGPYMTALNGFDTGVPGPLPAGGKVTDPSYSYYAPVGSNPTEQIISYSSSSQPYPELTTNVPDPATGLITQTVIGPYEGNHDLLSPLNVFNIFTFSIEHLPAVAYMTYNKAF
jgi:hypothetical protein